MSKDTLKGVSELEQTLALSRVTRKAVRTLHATGSTVRGIRGEWGLASIRRRAVQVTVAVTKRKQTLN